MSRFFGGSGIWGRFWALGALAQMIPVTVGSFPAAYWGAEAEGLSASQFLGFLVVFIDFTGDTRTPPGTRTPTEAATEYCQENGQLAFDIPFTKIPVTVTLSATAFFNFSPTNDVSVTFPPSAGVSVDVTVGAPRGPNIPVQVGAGKNASVGTFLTPRGPSSLSLSVPLVKPVGAPVRISPTVANACGLRAGGG